MCTLILLHRPGTAWPLLAAANRDEILSRPWEPPGFHWPGQPTVIAPRDTLAGGTWLALRTDGQIAAILNRAGSLGPAPGKSSRGTLPLLALSHPTAEAAAKALADRDLAAYRPFNLVLADRETAWCVSHTGARRPALLPLAPGLHMITAGDPDDPADPRIARHHPRFAAAEPPAPPDWRAWPSLLADREGPAGAALNIPESQSFGTSSASLVAIGAAGETPHLAFAAGPPHRHPFRCANI